MHRREVQQNLGNVGSNKTATTKSRHVDSDIRGRNRWVKAKVKSKKSERKGTELPEKSPVDLLLDSDEPSDDEILSTLAPSKKRPRPLRSSLAMGKGYLWQWEGEEKKPKLKVRFH